MQERCYFEIILAEGRTTEKQVAWGVERTCRSNTHTEIESSLWLEKIGSEPESPTPLPPRHYADLLSSSSCRFSRCSARLPLVIGTSPVRLQVAIIVTIPAGKKKIHQLKGGEWYLANLAPLQLVLRALNESTRSVKRSNGSDCSSCYKKVATYIDVALALEEPLYGAGNQRQRVFPFQEY